MREGFVHTTGGRVFYRIASPNAPGSPVLVIHGGPGISHDYLEPLEAVRNTILEAEASGDFTAPEYQEATAAFYRKHVCCLDPWPDCMDRAIEKMNYQVYEHMWGPSEFTMTGSLKNYDRTDDLWRITIPVLFTCGRFDEATPETTADYQSRLPGSEMRIFENASHEHHLEQPEAYLQAVRNFLSRVEHG